MKVFVLGVIFFLAALMFTASATEDSFDILRDLTGSELSQLMPGLSSAKANEYVGHLNEAMRSANIDTPARQAAFLAQLGHESGNLKWFKEFASGKAYEGRKDLGNTNSGDGVKFKGRGPIQITGRANYRAAGKALGVDLESNPTMAERPDIGFKTAAWFWNSRNLNQYADKKNQDAFDRITKRINGGYNGKADRDTKYRAALNLLDNGKAPAAAQPAAQPAKQPTQRQQQPARQPTQRQQTRPTRQTTRPSRQPTRQTRPVRQNRQNTRNTRNTRNTGRQTRPTRQTSRNTGRQTRQYRPTRQTSRNTGRQTRQPTRSSSRSPSRSYSRPTRSYTRPTRSSSPSRSYSRPTRSYSPSRSSSRSYSRSPSRSTSYRRSR